MKEFSNLRKKSKQLTMSFILMALADEVHDIPTALQCSWEKLLLQTTQP